MNDPKIHPDDQRSIAALHSSFCDRHGDAAIALLEERAGFLAARAPQRAADVLGTAATIAEAAFGRLPDAAAALHDRQGSTPSEIAADLLGHVEARQDYIPKALKALSQNDGPGVAVFLRDPALHGLAERLTGAPKPEALDRSLKAYGVGAQILLDLGVRTIRVITNNPRKLVGLDGYGLVLHDRVRLEMPASDDNAEYLKTKRTKLGHLFAI